MEISALSPLAQVVFIISFLVVLLLVAHNRKYGENILWFLSTLGTLLWHLRFPSQRERVELHTSLPHELDAPVSMRGVLQRDLIREQNEEEQTNE